MNTDTTTIATKLIRTEDAPPFGAGQLPIEDDRLYSGLAHLFAIVVWPWKRAASPAVDAHGKEALNLAITWLLVMIPLNIVLGFLPLFIIRICSLALSLVSLGVLGIAIYGLILARQGKLLRYPFNLRLIK
jgi:uncharacterized Tic20 family protein